MPSASVKRITYIYFSRCARVYRKYSTWGYFVRHYLPAGKDHPRYRSPLLLSASAAFWGCMHHYAISIIISQLPGRAKKREEEEGKVRKEYFISEHRHTHKMENFLSAGNNITCGEGLCPTSWVVNESSWPTTWPSIHAEHTHTE